MKVLLSEERLQCGVQRMASQIVDHSGNRPLTMVGVMTGSLVLLADLIRLLEMPLRVGVVQATSYRGGTTAGRLAINADLMPDITDHDVVVVDDIFDTGHTMVEVMALMAELRPKSIHSAVLLEKEGRREVDYRPDFVAFPIPDAFVVGYGLDYQDLYRNLPFVATLDENDLNDNPE